MTESVRVGHYIRSLRKRIGYTQEKLANELFISQSYLRLIEHGKTNPTVNMVKKITSFLEAKQENIKEEALK